MQKRLLLTHPYNFHTVWLYYDVETNEINRVIYADEEFEQDCQEEVDLSDEELLNHFERDLSVYLYACS